MRRAIKPSACLAVALAIGLADRPAAAQELAGRGFVGASLSPSIATFFGRPVIGGALTVGGGGMATHHLGLGGELRIDGGQLDWGLLPTGSVRLSFILLGVLNTRATLAAGLGAGVVGVGRNTVLGAPTLSSLLAGDVTLAIDLTRPASGLGARLYLPIATSILVFPQVHDGLGISFALTTGLGCRYR